MVFGSQLRNASIFTRLVNSMVSIAARTPDPCIVHRPYKSLNWHSSHWKDKRSDPQLLIQETSSYYPQLEACFCHRPLVA
jgi:hypothetical protein